MEIKKKDLGSLVETPIKTHKSLISEGRITSKKRPTQVTFRLPASQVEWLRRRVDGNTNYVVAKIMERGIQELNEKMATQDFDIDDW